MRTIMLMIAATLSAMASITFHTDKTTFLSSTSSTRTIDFEGIAPPGGEVSYLTADGLTIDGVNFVGQRITTHVGLVHPPTPPPVSVTKGYRLEVQDKEFWAIENRYPSAVLLAAGEYTQPPPFTTISGSIDITLPAAITAVGFNLSTVNTTGIFGSPTLEGTFNINIVLNGNQHFQIHTIDAPDFAFAGFISTDPITSISLTAPRPYNDPVMPFRVVLDDFVFGPADTAEIPEPSTALLTGLGLAITIAAVRRGTSTSSAKSVRES